MGFKSGDRVIVDFSRDDHRPDGNYVRKQIGEIVRGSSSDYLIEFDYRFTDDLHDGSVGIGGSKRHWFCRADTISLAGPELSKFKYRLGETYYFGSVYQTCKVVGYGKRCGVPMYIIKNQMGGSVGEEMTVLISCEELSGSGYIYIGIDEAHSYGKPCDTSEPLSKALASGDPIDSTPLPSWSKYRLGDQVKFKDGVSEGVGRIVGYDREEYYIIESDVITSDTAHELLDTDFIGPKLDFDRNKVRCYTEHEVEVLSSPGVSIEEPPRTQPEKPDWAKFSLGDLVDCECSHALGCKGIGKIVAYLDLKSYLIEGDFIVDKYNTPGSMTKIIGTPLEFDRNKVRRFYDNEVKQIKISPVVASKKIVMNSLYGNLESLTKSGGIPMGVIDHVGSMGTSRTSDHMSDKWDAMVQAMHSLRRETMSGGRVQMIKSRYSPSVKHIDIEVGFGGDDNLLNSPVILQKPGNAVKKLIVTDLF